MTLNRRRFLGLLGLGTAAATAAVTAPAANTEAVEGGLRPDPGKQIRYVESGGAHLYGFDRPSSEGVEVQECPVVDPSGRLVDGDAELFVDVMTAREHVACFCFNRETGAVEVWDGRDWRTVALA
jgi:hypothetical protein